MKFVSLIFFLSFSLFSESIEIILFESDKSDKGSVVEVLPNHMSYFPNIKNLQSKTLRDGRGHLAIDYDKVDYETFTQVVHPIVKEVRFMTALELSSLRGDLTKAPYEGRFYQDTVNILSWIEKKATITLPLIQKAFFAANNLGMPDSFSRACVNYLYDHNGAEEFLGAQTLQSNDGNWLISSKEICGDIELTINPIVQFGICDAELDFSNRGLRYFHIPSLLRLLRKPLPVGSDGKPLAIKSVHFNFSGNKIKNVNFEQLKALSWEFKQSVFNFRDNPLSLDGLEPKQPENLPESETVTIAKKDLSMATRRMIIAAPLFVLVSLFFALLLRPIIFEKGARIICIPVGLLWFGFMQNVWSSYQLYVDCKNRLEGMEPGKSDLRFINGFLFVLSEGN